MNHLGTPPLRINVEPDAMHRGQIVGAGAGGDIPADAYRTPDGSDYYQTPDGSDYYAEP